MKLFYIALLSLSNIHTTPDVVNSVSPSTFLTIQKDLTLYVKDKNGQPIPKATLRDQTKDQHFEFGQDGKLILKTTSVNTDDEYLITCIGFKSIRLTGTEIIKSTHRVFTLSEDAQDLKEVSVQSSSFKLDFKNVAKLPYPLSYHAITTDREAVYVIGGTSQWNILKQALKYSPATNSWSLLSNKILPTFQSSAGYIESTGKIYVIGGMTSVKNHTIFEKVETIDVKTGEVKILPVKNPMPATYAGSAVWNNKMYIFGGSTSMNSSWRGPATNHVYEFLTQLALQAI